MKGNLGKTQPILTLKNIIRITIVTSLFIVLWCSVKTPLSVITGSGLFLDFFMMLHPIAFFLTGLNSLKPANIKILRNQTLVNTPAFANVPLPLQSGDQLNIPVTVLIPVYTEQFEVIQKTLTGALCAVKFYQHQAVAPANLVVCDDALMVWASNNLPDFENSARNKPISERSETETKVLQRLDYYRSNRIGFIARPKPISGVEATGRKGLFKKASNINHGMRLATQYASYVAQGLSPEKALQRTLTQPGLKYSYAEMDIQIHDLLLLLDKDSDIPSEIIVKTVPEFMYDPKLGFTQNRSNPSNCMETSFTGAISLYLNILYDLNTGNKALLGGMVQFYGHNGFIRRSVLEGVSFFKENRVTEDTDFAMMVNAIGYHGKYICYSGADLGEQVSRNYIEESGKYKRYSFGTYENVFNPIQLWWKEGVLNNSFIQYTSSPFTKWYEVIDLILIVIYFTNLALFIPELLLFIFTKDLTFLFCYLWMYISFLPLIIWFTRMRKHNSALQKLPLTRILINFFLLAVIPFSQSVAVVKGITLYLCGKKPAFETTSVAQISKTTIKQALSDIANGLKLELLGLGPVIIGAFSYLMFTKTLDWMRVLALLDLSLPIIVPFASYSPLIEAIKDKIQIILDSLKLSWTDETLGE
jgi:cellulose synthase/poly-beta-1,6-N-acetylglucosamine synthase-like glycosyltransferase